jgi:peptidoglycan hydrolase-like protein with peptidoglycan-binding domain
MNKKMNLSNIGIIIAALVVMGVPAFASADTLYRQLETGMSGSDVGSLQTFLSQDASLYPQGLVTNYFGIYTKAAVARFQTRNDIPSVGRVGPITLPIINTQMSMGMGVGAGTDVWAADVSNIGVKTNENSAVISWTTSEQARGTVHYSGSPLTVSENLHSVAINGQVASTDSSLRSSQNVTLSGLDRNTTYYYIIHTTDGAGNVSMVMQSSFKTN